MTRLSVLKTGLDTTLCRGFYLSAKNTDHPLVKQLGGNVIALARGLDRPWERFVFVKELMHLFDDPSEATDTGDRFEKLLAEFLVPQQEDREEVLNRVRVPEVGTNVRHR